MNEAPRQTLRELIAKYGSALCSDEKRCTALLRDLCGAHRREVNILSGALRERVPLDLLAARNSMPRDLLLARLAKRLEEHLALTADAARWAVDSWALALGVVTDAEVEERQRRSPGAAAPPAVAAPSRPANDDDAGASRTPTHPDARPHAPPQRRHGPTPPPSQAPPVSRTAGHTSPAPTATRPPARGGSTVAARQTPVWPPAAAPPDTGRLQAPSTDPTARRGRGRWRGCLVGCFLLLLLSALLFVGGPFVVNLLREEQRQSNPEPPFGQSP